jgi:hypothetical protein
VTGSGGSPSQKPAPPAREAPETLAALTKKLPAVLETWEKQRYAEPDMTPALRRVRATSDTAAKVVVLLTCRFGAWRLPERDCLLVVHLKYYGRVWTTTRFEWSRETDEPTRREAGQFLMDAIDEAAEK